MAEIGKKAARGCGGCLVIVPAYVSAFVLISASVEAVVSLFKGDWGALGGASALAAGAGILTLLLASLYDKINRSS